jgi:RHS repeat-associated protein
MAAPYICETRRGPDGRIVEKTETVRGRKSAWTYAYDGEGRLAEAKLDGRLICQCWYDREGRRVRDYLPATAGANYRDYRYTPDNRLMRAGGGQYSHDEGGFRSIWSDKGVYTLYEYAPDYRLLKAEEEDRDKAFTFAHDEDGQRVAKYLNGQLVEAYQWLDFVRLAAFHDGQHAYEFAYRDGERTPFAMRRDDGVVAGLFYDQVGSLRVVADMDDNVIKEVLYDPFGGIIEDTNPDLRLPLGFAGGLHDRDLGFVRFGWRDYDVRTGRWTAPDPIGDKGGDPDWYGYCLDDPVNGNDPMGLAPWLSDVIEENFGWETVWIWRAKENACEKCRALDGAIIPEGTDIDSMRPHPNCKCEAKKAREGFKFGDWVTTWKGPTLEYDYVVFSSNLTGAALSVRWSRKYAVLEERTKKRIRICDGERTILEDQKEQRKRYAYEVRWNNGICWAGGGDPSGCEYYLIKNPWTNKTERYTPPLGP